MNYVYIIDFSLEAVEMIVSRNRGEHAAHFFQCFKFADIFRAYVRIFAECAVGFLGVKLIKSPVTLYIIVAFFTFPYELYSLRNRHMLKHKRGENAEAFLYLFVSAQHPIDFVAAYGCVAAAVCIFSCRVEHPHGESALAPVGGHYGDIICAAACPYIRAASDARRITAVYFRLLGFFYAIHVVVVAVQHGERDFSFFERKNYVSYCQLYTRSCRVMARGYLLSAYHGIVYMVAEYVVTRK